MHSPLPHTSPTHPSHDHGSHDHGTLQFGFEEIAYHRDGAWSIRTIALDGVRRRPHAPHQLAAAARAGQALPAFTRESVPLDEGDPIFLRIYHRLEHEWRHKVQNAVIDQLAADRDAAPDIHADQRRAWHAGI
jgi:hypothetical protein